MGNKISSEANGLVCLVCGVGLVVAGTGGLCYSCYTANLELAKKSLNVITTGVAAVTAGAKAIGNGFDSEKESGEGS